MNKLNCKCGNEVVCNDNVVEVTCMTCIMKFVQLEEARVQSEIDECTRFKTTLPVHKRKKWTREEDLILIKKSPSKTIKELMELLQGRSGYSIQYRISKLGIEGTAKQSRIGAVS
tara:strand:- start:499 stop:843 length:345 start_codon:yes stop_codon:yes gene_type:complete